MMASKASQPKLDRAQGSARRRRVIRFPRGQGAPSPTTGFNGVENARVLATAWFPISMTNLVQAGDRRLNCPTSLK